MRGELSFQEMHYIVAEKNKKTMHFVDIHEMGLFKNEEILSLFEKNGISAKFLEEGLMKNRGLFIGVKR